MAGKERYKREIAMLFPYMSKKEKMFLNNYMHNIEDAEYKDIVKEWGAPIAVVHSYIEAQDTEIIMKKLNRRKLLKKFLSAVLFLLIATLAIYTYFLNKSYQAVRDTVSNEIKETLIIEE